MQIISHRVFLSLSQGCVGLRQYFLTRNTSSAVSYGFIAKLLHKAVSAALHHTDDNIIKKVWHLESNLPDIKLHDFNVVGRIFIKKQVYNILFAEMSHKTQNITK